MLSFTWIWRRTPRPDPEKAVIDDMKKRAKEANERVNGAVAEVEDAMNAMLDDTIRAVGRGRRK